MTVAGMPGITRPEPERDRWGRYLIVPETGGKPVAHTRVTTFRDALDDRYNLEKWKLRTAAKGLAERQDLYAAVAAARADDKATLDRLCESALEAGKGSVGANLGTALHSFCEQVDLGETINIPAPWDADVAAYQKTLAEHDVRIIPDFVEQIVVIPDYDLAGTFDRIIDFGSVPKVADLKTGSTLDYSWGSISVQLACYAHAKTIYDPATRTHRPMPQVDQDVALVVHVPAGKARCELWWVDIRAGWEAAQHAHWVRGWRKRKDLAEAWRDDQPTANPDVNRARLIERIQNLKAVGHLQTVADNWPVNVPTFKQSPDHTHEDLLKIDQVLITVERLAQAPFGPLSPKEQP